MTTDLEIIKKLELAINHQLAHHVPSQENPQKLVSEMGVDPQFQQIMSRQSYRGDYWRFAGVGGAAKIDTRGHVTELKLAIALPDSEYCLHLISELTSLRYLNLSECGLNRLMPQLERLKGLLELDLGLNALPYLPDWLSRLRILETLRLDGNQLKVAPPELSQLENLNNLDLSKNQFADLPEAVGMIRRLRRLDLSANLLTGLPPTVHNLQSLTYISLARNRLRSLPQVILDLRSLEHLELQDNSITSLPHNFGSLKNLNLVDLRRNAIEELPSTLVEVGLSLDWEIEDDIPLAEQKGLFLAGNPIKYLPPEIRAKGTNAIRAYFSSLEGEHNLPLNEIKLLLVGDGGSGKTSLLKRLTGKKFDPTEPPTHGINLTSRPMPYNEQCVRLNLWDFGGQEIMHASHQFFLSRRSIYVLVLDGRKDEKTEYWLKHIESFGGDSPIFVLLNKADSNPSFDVNRKFLQEKYRSIVGFYRISCLTTDGLNDFVLGLSRHLFKLSHIQTTWPPSWFRVKTSLEDAENDYISYEEYLRLCEGCGVDQQEAQNTLLDFLHDLGVIVHFRELELRELGILNPRWVTEGVYRIINSKRLAEGKGVLSWESLGSALKLPISTPYIYDARAQRWIVDLMERFKLCYRLGKDGILVPDLLSVEAPSTDLDLLKSLRLDLQYDFLPKSVMPTFIVEMHNEIKDELRWRTGVVLASQAFRSIALVRADEDARKIEIYIWGEHKRDYLCVIRHMLRAINERFERVDVVELVPLPGREKLFIEYRELLGYELDGRSKIFVGAIRREFDVDQLLSGIAGRADRESDARRIFPEVGSERSALLVVERQVEFDDLRAVFLEFRKTLGPAESTSISRVDAMGNRLHLIEANSSAEELRLSLAEVGKLLVEVSNDKSEYNRIIKGTRRGILAAQRLAVMYNRLAMVLDLPEVGRIASLGL